jgi:hypothetical protein
MLIFLKKESFIHIDSILRFIEEVDPSNNDEIVVPFLNVTIVGCDSSGIFEIIEQRLLRNACMSYLV